MALRGEHALNVCCSAMHKQPEITNRSFFTSLLLALVIISLLGFAVVLAAGPHLTPNSHGQTWGRIATAIAILTLSANLICLIICPSNRSFTRGFALFLLLPSLIVALTTAVMCDIFSDIVWLGGSQALAGFIGICLSAYYLKTGWIYAINIGSRIKRSETPALFWCTWLTLSTVCVFVFVHGLVLVLHR